VDLKFLLLSPPQIPLDPPFSKWEVLRGKQCTGHPYAMSAICGSRF